MKVYIFSLCRRAQAPATDGLSVGHDDRDHCKNGWTDRDADGRLTLANDVLDTTSHLCCDELYMCIFLQ